MTGKGSKEQKKEGQFPERIRQHRVQKGLSQEELGKLTDLHYNHIGRYERGHSRPSADKLKALTDALEVSSNYLLNGSTEDFAKARFEDQDLLKMFREVEHLPDDEKNMVKKFLDAIITKNKLQEMIAK